MNYEQIDRMVRDANPIPDYRALAVESPVLPYEQGEVPMDTQIQTDNTERPRPSRNWLGVGLVAAAAVILIGVLALVLRDQDVPVAAPATSQETAEAYVSALGALDIELAESYSAQDATIIVGEDRSGDLAGWAAYEEAIGGGFEVASCVDNGSNFRCTISYNNDWGRALGVGPFGFGAALASVTDGRVTFLNLPCCGGTPEYWEAVAYPFDDFLVSNGYNEPEVAEGVDWSTTDDGIASYQRWTEEFVAEQAG